MSAGGDAAPKVATASSAASSNGARSNGTGDNGAASNGASTSGRQPAAKPKAAFGASRAPASPFGDMSMANMNSSSEPGNMSPTMSPDPKSEAPWWRQITKTQIVLFFTFTAMTLSMLATVIVVFKTGAIHFNSDAY